MRALAAVVLLSLLVAGCVGTGKTTSAPTPAAAAGPAPEAMVETGRVTAAMPSKDVTIPIKTAGHGRLAVTLVMLSNFPDNTLSVNVTGPKAQGVEVRTSPFLYVFPGANPTVSFDHPQTGDWTAHVKLSSGAAADYEVHWCADDEAPMGPPANRACHHSY
jgi:hypothetical protein